MKKWLIIILLLIPSVAFSATLYSEDFDDNDYSGILNISNGATHTYQATGGYDGDGCAYFTPPEGTGQGYMGIQFDITDSAVVYVSFIAKRESNWCGNSSGGKHIILTTQSGTDESRAILMEHSCLGNTDWHLNPCQNIDCGGTGDWDYAGPPCGSGDCSDAPWNQCSDYVDEWVWYVFYANSTTGVSWIKAWTRDGVWDGDMLSCEINWLSTGSPYNFVDTLGTYADVYSLTTDNGMYIDEVLVEDEMPSIPTGFVTEESTSDISHGGSGSFSFGGSN